MPYDNAFEIRQPDLKTFEHEEFFYVNETNDGVVFNAPCVSETTENSKYPRSELREMAYGGQANANWSTDNGVHIMVIDQMITSTPVVKPHVVVGQIHDADDDVVMIRLEGNRLFVEAEGVDLGALDENYKVGTRFKVKIKAALDVIDVYYNDDLMVSYPVHKEGCYFKAGMYTQSNASKGDDESAYGEVVMYNLSVEHTGIEKKFESDYTNAPIPESSPDAVLNAKLDTYIDLMKVDGILTPNVSPRNTDEMLMVKTSGGQTTIRLSFMEFDLSEFGEIPGAATLNVVGKDINGESTISVYGFEKSFGDNLTWGDLFSDASRISAKNSEVMDYLYHFGKKTGEVVIGAKDPSKPVEDKDKYEINVSSFLSQATTNIVTLVFVEEVGVNVNLQLHSNESDEAYAPVLKLWSGDGSAVVVEEPAEEAKEEVGEEPIEVVEEIGINLDVVDVDEALSLLSYSLLKAENGQIELPSVIGKDVNITWTSSNPESVGDDGLYTSDSIGKDITFTAEFTKNEEVFKRNYIIVTD